MLENYLIGLKFPKRIKENLLTKTYPKYCLSCYLLQLATQLLRYSDDLFAEVLKYKVILTFDKVQSES